MSEPPNGVELRPTPVDSMMTRILIVLEEVVADLAERLGAADELVGLGDAHRGGARRVGGDGAGGEAERDERPQKDTSNAPSSRSLSSSRPACSTAWVPLTWRRSGNFFSLSVEPDGVLLHQIDGHEVGRVVDCVAVARRDDEPAAEVERERELRVAADAVLRRPARRRELGVARDDLAGDLGGPEAEERPGGALEIVLGLLERQISDGARLLPPGDEDERAAGAREERQRERERVVVVRRGELAVPVLRGDLVAEGHRPGDERVVGAERDAHRAARRQAGGLVALRREDAARLQRVVDEGALVDRDVLLEVEDDLEADDAHREKIGEVDVEEGVLQRELERAARRVIADALVDGALGREAKEEALPRALEPEARVLQREAVVPPDERDVRIVLDEAALQAQEPEELVTKPGGRGRRRHRRRLGWGRDLQDLLLLLGKAFGGQEGDGQASERAVGDQHGAHYHHEWVEGV